MADLFVHPETDMVRWLHRRDLPAFLLAHGATHVESEAAQGISQRLRSLTEQLVQTSESMSRALAALNWLAQNAENFNLKSPELDARHLNWKELNWLLNLFESEGLLKLHRSRVRFRDESARLCANGGWLEQRVFGLVFGLRKEFPVVQDLARGTGAAVLGGCIQN